GTVAINQSLLTGAATIDLGSNANPFRDLYLGGTATNNFRFTGTAGAARTITLDDLSGRLALVQSTIGTAQTGFLNVSSSVQAGVSLISPTLAYSGTGNTSTTTRKSMVVTTAVNAN